MGKRRGYVAGAVGGAALVGLLAFGAGTVYAKGQPEPIVVKGNTVAQTSTGKPGSSIAKCPEGTRAVGGGYRMAGRYGGGGDREAWNNVLVNAPTEDGTGWEIASAWSNNVTAYALCATPAQ